LPLPARRYHPRVTFAENDRDPACVVAGRYEIVAGAPAAQFGAHAVPAYCAIDRDRPADPHFALICAPELPPRQDLIEPLGALRIDEVMTPRAWGVIDWPPLGRRCTALVFEAPGGARLCDALGEALAPMAEDEVLNAVLPSALAGLKALAGMGITHRAIRPTNLHRRAGERRIVFGECVSAPPACAQPLLFETIESGLAQPTGRGAGSIADDLYALGATVVFLLAGRDPGNGLSDEQLLAEKINRGSFATLLGGTRPSVRMLELLRGLLADDPRERWTLPDLDGWLDLRRLTVKQTIPAKRAARPLELGGVAHLNVRALAGAIAADPAEAARSIRSGEFDAWLQRSLADPERIAAVAMALGETANADPATPERRLAARVAMALDPRAPLRYGGFAVAIDGLGPALLQAYRAGSGAATIAEAVMARLPQFWLSVQSGGRPDRSPQLKRLERLRQLVDDRRPGFGIERLLYELNPGLHCLAPAIERDHVVAPDDLLAAIERACAAGRIGDLPVDRHIAAFVAARCRPAIQERHDGLASTDPPQRGLATLQVLARLQQLYGPAAPSALAERMRHGLPAMVDRYRSQSRRVRLRAAIANLGGNANLAHMVALVASPGELRRDEQEFERAQHECAAIKHAMAALRARVEMRSREAVGLGGRLAVAASIVLAWSAALVSLFMAG
jgi:eukaryotic-like serine/threonine-protein kinase